MLICGAVCQNTMRISLILLPEFACESCTSPAVLTLAEIWRTQPGTGSACYEVGKRFAGVGKLPAPGPPIHTFWYDTKRPALARPRIAPRRHRGCRPQAIVYN